MEKEEKKDLSKYKSLIVSGIIFVVVITVVSMITFSNKENVEIKEDSLSVQVGENYRIDYTLTGLNSEQLIWKSTNENVAVVDAKGNVTGISEGRAMIYVSDEDYIKTMIEVVVTKDE